MATAFAILPRKRSGAIKQFGLKVDNLSNELVSSVSSQLERDMENTRLQIVDSLSPLRNFYRTQYQKHEDSKSAIENIKNELESIKTSIP